MKVEFFKASYENIKEIFGFDGIFKDSPQSNFIEAAINSENCYLAKANNDLVGYFILDSNSDSDNEVFLSLSYIEPDTLSYQVGLDVLDRIEEVCAPKVLKTTVNMDNRTMINFLSKNGFSKGENFESYVEYFKVLK